jgi:hypothetical protein
VYPLINRPLILMQLNDIVIPGSPSNFITKRLHHLDTEKFFVASYDCKNKIKVNRSYISTYPVRVFPFQPSVTTGGSSRRKLLCSFLHAT